MEKFSVIVTGPRAQALVKLAKSKELRAPKLCQAIITAWLEKPTKLKIRKRFPAYTKEVEI